MMVIWENGVLNLESYGIIFRGCKEFVFEIIGLFERNGGVG